MKAKGIILALTILAGALTAAACSDQKVTVSRVDNKHEKAVEDSAAAEEETETAEKEEEQEEAEEQEEESEEAAEESSEKSAAQQAREEARNEADANAESEADTETDKDKDEEKQEEEQTPADDENANANDNDKDTQAAADELYKKSCDTFWGTLINCTYQLDESDQSGEGIRVVDFDSLDALKEKYMEVFAEPDPAIDEKYFEENGKLYCRDGARGANIYYRSTELIPVKITDFMAEYTAVSYFADPETNEPMDKKAYDFKMVNMGDGWRTGEFTLPY